MFVVVWLRYGGGGDMLMGAVFHYSVDNPTLADPTAANASRAPMPPSRQPVRCPHLATTLQFTPNANVYVVASSSPCDDL